MDSCERGLPSFSHREQGREGEDGEHSEWRYFRVLTQYTKRSKEEELEWLVDNWFGPSVVSRLNRGEGHSEGELLVEASVVSSMVISESDEERVSRTLASLRSGLSRVEWLPYSIYRMPKHIFISQSALHKGGKIVGMDAASVASVVALDVKRGHSVLDVCCCPGMKLSLISELIEETSSGTNDNSKTSSPSMVAKREGGIAVGIDISVNRLFVARSLLAKLAVPNTILCHCDGTQFAPSSLIKDLGYRRTPARQKIHLQRLRQRCEENDKKDPLAVEVKEATAVWCSEDLQRLLIDSGAAQKRARASIAEDNGSRKDNEYSNSKPSLPFSIPLLFDRVLVDAECTHDGSLHHIVKTTTDTSSNDIPFTPSFQDNLHMYKPNYTLHTEEADADLHNLQLRLLEKGFELVKPGGIVVYSTCSFSEGQNEAIVRRFMEKYGHIDGEGISNVGNADLYSAVLVLPFAEDKGDGVSDVNQISMSSASSSASSSPSHGSFARKSSLIMEVAEAGIGGLGVRMNPSKTRSSFQYIAKFRKEVRSKREKGKECVQPCTLQCI